MAPISGSPRSAKPMPYGSKWPTMGLEMGQNLQRARQPESDWRTFGTDCRRPMAPHTVSRRERTTKGALALSSKFLTNLETQPDDDPDHFGRRRAACHPGPAAEPAGAC